jgi:hypothetical protein
MRSAKMLFSVVISALLVGGAFAEILFQDDFESGKIDKSKWEPTAGWEIAENTDKHAVLGKFVLDVWGGDEGFSVQEFPEEYDYYADFKAMDSSLTGFIFHGQDKGNIYMHQVSVAGSGHTPQHIRWHRKVGGGWSVDPKPFADKKDRDKDTWYRVKFEVRGSSFKVYLGDVGAMPNELTLVSEWTDTQKAFKKGKIGFRMCCGTARSGEHAQYDNVLVVTPGASILAVYPQGKLSLTWGALKTR